MDLVLFILFLFYFSFLFFILFYFSFTLLYFILNLDKGCDIISCMIVTNITRSDIFVTCDCDTYHIII